MKKIYLIVIAIMGAVTLTNAQSCSVNLAPSTWVFQDDSTMIWQDMTPYYTQHILPCKSLKIDSAITTQNTILLRSGSSLTIDSNSTLYGGFVIYAMAGSSVDLNFKAASIYYENGATLMDTAGSTSSAILCPSITIDYSQMTTSPNCIPLNLVKHMVLSNISVYDKSNEWTIALPNVKGQTYWSLFSIDGKVVKTGFSNAKEINVDKSDLKTNLYILQIQNGQSGKRIKLLNY